MYRELYGLLLIFWALFLLLSLITFDPGDPSFNQVVSKGREVQNGAGLVGAYLGGLLVDICGVAAYALPVGFAVAGLKRFFQPLGAPFWRWLGIGLLGLCLAILAEVSWAKEALSIGAIQGGGYFGRLFHHLGGYYLSPLGGGLLWCFVFLGALQLTSGLTWKAQCQQIGALFQALGRLLGERSGSAKGSRAPAAGSGKFKTLLAKPLALWRDFTDMVRRHVAIMREGDDLERRRQEKGREQVERWVDGRQRTAPPPATDDPQDRPDPVETLGLLDLPHAVPEEPKSAPEIVVPTGPAEAVELPLDGPKITLREPRRKPRPTAGGLPSLDLLPEVVGDNEPPPMAELEDQAERLTTCLADFNVSGEVTKINPGPVVTMFEYKPAPGVKISRIAGLSHDLALSLKALAVRIEAPIPGKDSVGIEIPSKKRQTVHLREILGSKLFKSSPSLLTIALGQDIAGRPQVADLAKMPHLLVAGATGAGKSVCLNSILLSFMFKARPEELKLLLVDPKRIELSVYQDLPHLVHPVVTEMHMAKNALDWAVSEMDRRYEAMAKLGVRNIEGFNTKVGQLAARTAAGEHLSGEQAELERMPYLVIVIDELADLMLTAAKEVEMSVVRLAQLARAAGIHMILATQRPSVDVVTGLIKANFPCRISFQVTSKHDSRTILDQVGAEYLLGKGDMLFKPGGGRLQRMHGAFVRDEDVVAVADWWREQQPPDYQLDFENVEPGGEGGLLEGNPGDLAGDSMYKEAVAFVLSQGKASISLLQRRFRIGFNRSARYIEQMEIDGIVGPADGSKPRPVLKGGE